MTAYIPEFCATAMISLVSYPRSASKYCAAKPSISCVATAQSAVVPAVTKNRTGIPCASTARCILVLSPLLCVPYPDCRRLLRPHADEPLYSLHRSSAIRSLLPLSAPQGFAPRCACRATGKIVCTRSSNRRIPAADPAMALRFAVSRTRH